MIQQRTKNTFTDDYQTPVLRAPAYDLMNHFREKGKHLLPYFAMDSQLMHYKRWDGLVFNPFAKNSWKRILEQYYATEEFKQLNERVFRDPMLSRLATTNFLDSILKTAENTSYGLSDDRKERDRLGSDLQHFFDTLDKKSSSPNSQNAAKETLAEMLQDARDAAKETGRMAQVYQSFSHEGIPMAGMGDIDEMRDTLSNGIVVTISRLVKKLSENRSGRNMTKPSPRRGIPIGVKTMSSWSEIVDIVPSELVHDELLTYKLASRKVQVRQRYSGVNNYLVYLDKSGSMASSVRFEQEHVPKIAFASACVIALASDLRHHGGKLILKLFDTEVHEEITDLLELIRVAAKIRADGGTNITNVLEDAIDYGDYRTVVVSDGIDDVDEQATMRAKLHDVKCVLINTTNQTLENHLEVQHIEHFTGNFLLEV